MRRGGDRTRSYEREDFVFEPLHDLALTEQKINARDQAAPPAGWQWPEELMTLRRLLEARMDKQGQREFVQVLRLMECSAPMRSPPRCAMRSPEEQSASMQ
jgi:hypothetical protein